MTQPIHSWREAFQSYLQTQSLIIFFMGFAAGLPYLLIFSTLSVWLTESDVSRSSIGFFSWVGITFSIKVLWAPIVDSFNIPWLGKRFGKRRSWILLAQVIIALTLFSIGQTDPGTNLKVIVFLAVTVAFASATQDICIDAYRIESAGAEYQGTLSAMYIFGYRVALLVAGAGALYIAEYKSWAVSYTVMACLMSLGMLSVLVAKEPRHREKVEPEFQIKSWLKDSVLEPFADFFSRYAKLSLLILLLVSLYKLSDVTMGSMANPFYLDIGFSKLDIANIGKVFGFVMTLIGSALGGVLVMRYGIFRPLLIGAILVASSNLLFAIMAMVGAQKWMLIITISADNISGGLATAAFIAYLSSLTSTNYTATQYALFSSIMTLPAKFLSGFSGIFVERYGYFDFFIYAAALGLPAIALVILVMVKQVETGKEKENF